MSEENETNTMELWNRFAETNPKYTKEFKRAGGFNGNSINATFVAKMLTEKFGPFGIGWGWDILNEQYKDGAPIILDKAAEPVCNEVIHIIRLQFWYRKSDGPDGIVKCPPHYGQTTFIGKNKYGVYTDEEAPKKSITDAFVKSSSMLGVAADIFTGMYDDSKYVNDLNKKYKNGSSGDGSGAAPKNDAAGNGHKSPDKTVEEAQAILGGQEETAYTNDAYGRIDKFLAEKTNGSESAVKSKLRSLAKSSGVDPKILNTIESVSKLNPEQASMIAKHIKDSEDIPF